MQPTLFTATFAADRAAVAPQAPRPVRRIRIPRRLAAAAVVATLALGGGLMTAGDAPATSSSSTGLTRHSDFRSAIVSPGQFGWQARCPHTGPAPR